MLSKTTPSAEDQTFGVLWLILFNLILLQKPPELDYDFCLS